VTYGHEGLSTHVWFRRFCDAKGFALAQQAIGSWTVIAPEHDRRLLRLCRVFVPA
jgi:hypothetical protein